MSSIPFGAVPSEVEFMLCVGIGKMLQAKYGPHFGDQSKYLSIGILNFALETPPGNEEAERYCEANRCLIEQQAHAIHLDFELAYAFSILFSFVLVRLGPTDPGRTAELVERASALHIILRTTKEICPTDDAITFLQFVRKYASDLIEK
jgi:hypothetical protein